MIDALAGPGTAVDIRISTLEPIQQLRMHFANLLSGELSRLRADAAFASVTGSAVQAPASQNDHLRAQQRSVLGQFAVSLRSNSAIQAETTTLAEHYVHADAENVDTASYEPEQRIVDGWHQDGKGEESSTVDHTDALMIEALRSALIQFKVHAEDAGYSGSPIAIALPAKQFLDAYASADVRGKSATSGTMDTSGVLILCLAFDGRIGGMHSVMGVLCQQDSMVGQFHADWSEAIGGSASDVHSTLTAEPHSLVSDVLIDSGIGRISGIRVKLDDVSPEPAHWFWHIRQWSWS